MAKYKYLRSLDSLRRTIQCANEKIVIQWFSYDDYDIRPHYRMYVRDNATTSGSKKFNSYPDSSKPYDGNLEMMRIANTDISQDEIVASILLLCYESDRSADINIHIDDSGTEYDILEEDYYIFKKSVIEGLVCYLGEFS